MPKLTNSMLASGSQLHPAWLGVIGFLFQVPGQSTLHCLRPPLQYWRSWYAVYTFMGLPLEYAASIQVPPNCFTQQAIHETSN